MNDLLIPGQPYPTIPAWEDIAHIVTNGWQVAADHLYLMAERRDNTIKLDGRMIIGEGVQIGVLPSRLRPARPVIKAAGWVRDRRATCEVDVWGNGALRVAAASLPQGVTIEDLHGTYFSFTMEYPAGRA